MRFVESVRGDGREPYRGLSCQTTHALIAASGGGFELKAQR